MHYDDHRSIKTHLKTHKKRYVRFTAFFLMLVLFAYIEDVIVALFSGSELSTRMLMLILFIAIIFTFIAEHTEKLFEKEAEEAAEIVESEEAKVKKFLKKK